MVSDKQKVLIIILLLGSFFLYSFRLYISLPGKDNLGAVNTDRGKMVWQKYNCTACHQIYGLGGFLGPDLTNAYSKRGPDYIKAFLKYGTATMPDFHLSELELSSILDYLKDIDASGKSDPKTFIINKDGTIQQ